MWDIFISFVSGVAFIGGFSAMVCVVMAFRRKPEPSDTDKQLLIEWKDRNFLYREQIGVLKEILNAINQHNQKRQEAIAQNICPACAGELDTVWECNSCGFDARPEVLAIVKREQ